VVANGLNVVLKHQVEGHEVEDHRRGRYRDLDHRHRRTDRQSVSISSVSSTTEISLRLRADRSHLDMTSVQGK
jgi:hypothetical protein